MNADVMFSSKSSEWGTPQDLFDSLNMQYHFNLDPASTDQNAKCKKHFTILDNGLEQDWGGHSVFVNPPYGREIGKWVKKGFEESQKPDTLVVMLLPARTDTAWFHEYCVNGKIRFLRGRLKFGGGHSPAPFPSMIVIFGEEKEEAK